MSFIKNKAGSGFKWKQPLGLPDNPYAYRWVLPLGPLGSIRLHYWLCSDDLRATHDHPNDFLTFVIKGSYIDCRENEKGEKLYEPIHRWNVRFRKAEHRHEVIVLSPGTITLLWFGPPRRDWGFYVPRKIGGFRFLKAHKYFLTYGNHVCDE